MTRTLLTTAAILSLAACDAPTPTRQVKVVNPANSPEAANAYKAKLLALGEGQRNTVFFNAIVANNGACPGVTKAAFQQMYKDMTMWVVTCTMTGDFAVFVNGAGFAQVRQCNHEKGLGLPECTVR